MLENIREAFKNFTFLSPKDLIQIAAMARLKTIPAGEHFLKEGDLNYQAMFVLKGLFRHYVIDKNGIDKTLLFLPERNQTACPDTIFQNKPSTENFVAWKIQPY